jgi:hypothetical protein
MEDDDRSSRYVDCKSAIRDALAKTLSESMDGLQRKYDLNDDEVREAIGWAGINLAVNSYSEGLPVGDDERAQLQIHINHMIKGCRVGWKHAAGQDEHDR